MSEEKKVSKYPSWIPPIIGDRLKSLERMEEDFGSDSIRLAVRYSNDDADKDLVISFQYKNKEDE